ncbi:MAG: hypothetical protein RBS07_09775 [Lentimicrobium sp.]|jgi:hypothetical protein|nr:hypothetical protein [Lentimicrobium sp.]
MKTKQLLTSQEFIKDNDISSTLGCSDHEYLPGLSDVAIYAALPDADLNIKDYVNVVSISQAWYFVHKLRDVVQSNFDFSNVDFDEIADPRERQMAKFLFKENDPAVLLPQFDRVIYYAFFQSQASMESPNDANGMRKFMEMIKSINAIPS